MTTAADVRAPVRPRLGIAAVVLAGISAMFPVWVFLVGVATQDVDVLEAADGAWVLVTVLVLVAEVALMPITGIVWLILAILAIRRDRGRKLGVVAIVLLGIGLVLVVAQIAVYVSVTTLVLA